MEKGMLVFVLRMTTDCTNGGVTATHDKFVLIGDGIPGGFEPSESAPALRLVRRWEGTPNEYLHCEPLEKPEGRPLGGMAGGNFVYSSDSRFRKISKYPIPVHDRFETQAQYDLLSR